MKLINFRQLNGYFFNLNFENGEVKTVDLSELLQAYVSEQDLNSAHLNKEWGCLEFNQGMVDIEPKTLYRYALQKTESRRIVC